MISEWGVNSKDKIDFQSNYYKRWTYTHYRMSEYEKKKITYFGLQFVGMFYFIVRKIIRNFILCKRFDGHVWIVFVKMSAYENDLSPIKKEELCCRESERDPSWFEMMILSGFTILNMSCRMAVSFHPIAIKSEWTFDVLHSTFTVRTAQTVCSDCSDCSGSRIFALRFTWKMHYNFHSFAPICSIYMWKCCLRAVIRFVQFL